jgi:hypothetical protein
MLSYAEARRIVRISFYAKKGSGFQVTVFSCQVSGHFILCLQPQTSNLKRSSNGRRPCLPTAPFAAMPTNHIQLTVRVSRRASAVKKQKRDWINRGPTQIDADRQFNWSEIQRLATDPHRDTQTKICQTASRGNKYFKYEEATFYQQAPPHHRLSLKLKSFVCVILCGSVAKKIFKIESIPNSSYAPPARISRSVFASLWEFLTLFITPFDMGVPHLVSQNIDIVISIWYLL